ncbi:MAG: hypothetical protein OHK0023_03440 [Anaerolineae bacterium]
MLIAFIIAQLAPAQARIPVEPPQTVQTNHPILCMHTRLTDEVESIKIYRTLQMVREMGATAIVEFFPWAYVQPDENIWDWSHPDRIITLAHHQGVKVIARLGIVPAWARPEADQQQTSLNYLTPEYDDAFAAFAAAFAARYADTVSQIIIWNEPNLSFEWGFQPVSAQRYVDLLKVSYTAIKAVNPHVEVLGGALAPTLEPEMSPHALNDLSFLRQMYEFGAKNYFDALAAHTYGFTLPPDDPPAADRLNFRRFELLLEIMREYGDAEKSVYITESSWNDHPRWQNAVTPGQRVTYTLRALEFVEQAWPTVRKLCFWMFRAPTLYKNYMDSFAFVTLDFRPRPIYEEVKQWAKGD